MARHYSDEFIINVVKRCELGESPSSLSKELNIAQSTVYRWIKTHRMIQIGDEIYTPDRYEKQVKLLTKLENILEVIRLSGCIDEIPLRRKLEILESIHKQHPNFSVTELCEALGVARGTFYNHIYRRVDPTKKANENYALMLKVQEIFDSSNQTYGVKRVHAALAQQGIRISNKRLGKLMREMGLECVRTDAKAQYILREKRIKANLVRRNFSVNRPNEIWVSDFTAFKVKRNWLYLCVIMDLYSRMVVGYNISRNASTQLLTRTFKEAYHTRGKPVNLMFHSDQGSQFTSKAFTNLLVECSVKQSFSGPGQPLDNAVAESFFSSFKKEEAYRKDYTSERHFRESVSKYIDFYNNIRTHQTLNYKTPASFESKFTK